MRWSDGGFGSANKVNTVPIRGGDESGWGGNGGSGSTCSGTAGEVRKRMDLLSHGVWPRPMSGGRECPMVLTGSFSLSSSSCLFCIQTNVTPSTNSTAGALLCHGSPLDIALAMQLR